MSATPSPAQTAEPDRIDALQQEVAGLRATNAELRRANARLARERLGRHDSAAASVLSRLERRLGDAEAEVKRLEARLETEMEVAARNHAMFERARDQLQAPRYVVMDRIRARLLTIPGLQRLTRAITRRLAS